MKRLLASLVLLGSLPLNATDLGEAKQLMGAQRIPEAIPVLEKIIAAEPQNVDALVALARCQASTQQSTQAVETYRKASELAPSRAEILAEYGASCFNEAGKTRSLSLTRSGRSALEKALELEPGNRLAHEALLQFFANAPWIVGGSMSKAYEHAEALRAVDPQRGLILLVSLHNKEKKYDASFALCDSMIRQDPNNVTALYELGRTANLSGNRLADGLAALEKYLSLPPKPNNAPPAAVHYRMGLILEQQGDKAKAREHYEAGLKIDPKHARMAEALAKLDPKKSKD